MGSLRPSRSRAARVRPTPARRDGRVAVFAGPRKTVAHHRPEHPGPGLLRSRGLAIRGHGRGRRCAVRALRPEGSGGRDVNIKDLYSIVVTDKHVECRDFYVRWFGFQVVFEASWFVYLAAAGDHAFGLAFMAPDHPSQPPGPDR